MIRQSTGAAWTRIMFQRQVLAKNYWQKPAATKPKLYPSGTPLSDALVHGEVSITPLVYRCIIYPKEHDGAPLNTFMPPEGVPIMPYASGMPEDAQNPDAPRLYMKSRSPRKARLLNKQHGNLTWLKEPPLLLRRDNQGNRAVDEKIQGFQSLFGKWIEESNKV